MDLSDYFELTGNTERGDVMLRPKSGGPQIRLNQEQAEKVWEYMSKVMLSTKATVDKTHTEGGGGG